MLQPSSGPIHRRDAEFTEIGVLDQEIFTLRPQRLRGEYFFSIDTIRIAAEKFTTFVGGIGSSSADPRCTATRSSAAPGAVL